MSNKLSGGRVVATGERQSPSTVKRITRYVIARNSRDVAGNWGGGMSRNTKANACKLLERWVKHGVTFSKGMNVFKAVMTITEAK